MIGYLNIFPPKDLLEQPSVYNITELHFRYYSIYYLLYYLISPLKSLDGSDLEQEMKEFIKLLP